VRGKKDGKIKTRKALKTNKKIVEGDTIVN
jgi:hypothetical protein